MRIRKTGDFFARYFFREPRKRAGEKVTKSLLSQFAFTHLSK